MPFRVLAVLVLALAVAAFGQTSISASGATSAGGTFNGAITANFSAQAFAPPAVPGAPYSGEEVSEHVQTLADGTHITHTMPGQKIFRDSQGRTRTERAMMAGQQATDAPVLVQINDPIAGYQYTLDPGSRVAHRVALPPPGTRPAMMPSGRIGAANTVTDVFSTRAVLSPVPLPPPPPRQDGSGAIAVPNMIVGQAGGTQTRPQVQNEDLGTQMIDGVLCTGRRTTMTFPVGSQGNDRPIVVVNETWMSAELKMMVRSKNSDPRSGENTFRIANLSRTEPDPGLFQPPPDFQVVDETAPFTITFGK
jgi:hypothetical protein